MNAETAASAYKEATFDNAPPIKIVHMMYEGAIRFLEQAAILDPEVEFREFNEKIGRAEAIVTELRLAVDHEQAPELGKQLDELYLFVEHQLREAFLKRTAEPLTDANEVLKTLLEGWKKVEVDIGGAP